MHHCAKEIVRPSIKQDTGAVIFGLDQELEPVEVYAS